MNIRYYFQNVSEDCKKGVQTFFSQKKLSQIEKLISAEKQGLCQLTVRVEHFKKHDAFSVKIELACGSEILLGQEQSHDIKKALNLAVKRLVSQVKK